MIDTLFFYAFAAMTLAGAVLTITRRNPIHSAMWLAVSLLGVAGLFLLERAEFLFAVQIVLYVGGVLILFLFVMMLVNLDRAAHERPFNSFWWLGLTGVAAIAIEVVFAVRHFSAMPEWTRARQPVMLAQPNTEKLADLLFTGYLLPFEIASVLLLVAIVGSVFMAQKPAA